MALTFKYLLQLRGFVMPLFMNHQRKQNMKQTTIIYVFSYDLLEWELYKEREEGRWGSGVWEGKENLQSAFFTLLTISGAAPDLSQESARRFWQVSHMGAAFSGC